MSRFDEFGIPAYHLGQKSEKRGPEGGKSRNNWVVQIFT